MNQITILKKIIDDQAILINKLQGYIVDNIKPPKKISSNKLSMAEARVKLEIFLKRQQKKNSSF